MSDPVIKDEISHLEAEFKDTGRVLIRPSGTEPCVRVMIEGTDYALINKRANYLAKLIEARFS